MKDYNTNSNQNCGCIDHKDEQTLRHLYWDKEHSINEIADLAGVSYATIHYWMEKHSIDRLSDVDGSKRTQSTNYISVRVNNNGHAVWRDTSPGGGTVPVHRLLAISEYGFDSVLNNDVHHKNGIPWDNRVENLEVLSRSDHMSHHNIGENNPDSRLSIEEVTEIKENLSEGDTPYKLAKEYPVTSTTIREIRDGELWASV